MHLKAQEADDIHWMQQDETQRENQKLRNLQEKRLKNLFLTLPSPKAQTLGQTPTPLRNHIFSTNGNSASSGSKDKTKPNPLANKLGKNGKTNRRRAGMPHQRRFCAFIAANLDM